jgi:uncharacterized Zn finger protein
MSFKRTKEDFACEQCGTRVKGSGYTNHCHTCLWSKHVDLSPGDRSSLCGGSMEPVGLDVSGNGEKIMHRCVRCGFVRRQSVAKEDSRDALVSLSTKPR